MHKSFLKLFGGAFRPSLGVSKKALFLSGPQKFATFGLSTTAVTYFLYQTSQNKQVFMDNDFKDVEAFATSDLQDGQMREVQVGPTKEEIILISKFNGKFYATGANCSHFGAPLSQGALVDDKIYCPWHAAQFSIIDGKADSGPMFDGIETYKLREEKGKLIVTVPKQLPGRKTMDMVGRDKNDNRKFVILGAGAAALSAAETLRQSGYGGEIILVAKDNHLPYDRTMLSKNIASDINKIRIRDQAFFDKYGITVLTGKNVTNVNADKKTVEVEGGSPIQYDKLLVATGARPRIPTIPGADTKNVFTLRGYNDLEKIREATSKAKNVVIIGASFIGTEAAAALKNELKDKINITVVDISRTPFQVALGDEVGNVLKGIHENNGVKFVLEKGIKSIQDAGSSKKIVLSDNSELAADVVLLGTGVQPNTEMVSKAVKVDKFGGIETDNLLQTSNKDIYAAGDVASYPYWYSGNRIRIEHYSEAIQQGQVAAYNMLDKKVPHNGIPFFWTRHYFNSLQYIGNSTGYDTIWVDGDTKKPEFLAFYAKGDKVLAVAGMGKSPSTMVLSSAMASNQMPSLSEFKSGKVNIDELRKKLQTGKPRCRRADCCKHKQK